MDPSSSDSLQMVPSSHSFSHFTRRAEPKGNFVSRFLMHWWLALYGTLYRCCILVCSISLSVLFMRPVFVIRTHPPVVLNSNATF